MRLFFMLSTLILGLFAKPTLVDGISFFVNEQPVTLFELYKTEQSLGVSQENAIEHLIRRELENAEIKRYGISISQEQLESEINRVASGYNLSYYQFKDSLESRGIRWESYKKDLKRKLELDELSRKIVREKIEMPTQESAREFYELNADRFVVPRIVDVVQYSSESKEALKKQVETPFSVIDGVVSSPTTLDTTKYSAEFAELFARTKEGSFTPVIESGGSFVSFYIKSKSDFVAAPFEDVEQQVVDMMLKESENRILNSHFEKLRAQANINVIRLP